MRHHTKDQGDLGVACIIADLAKHDVGVAMPLSEHLPFDLIAVSPDHGLCRLSVKYRTTYQGSVCVNLKSFWADRHGTHVVVHDKSSYDAIAIYAPDADECYYVRVSEVAGVTLRLRLQEPRSKQRRGIRMARDYRDPLRIFAPEPSAHASPTR